MTKPTSKKSATPKTRKPAAKTAKRTVAKKTAVPVKAKAKKATRVPLAELSPDRASVRRAASKTLALALVGAGLEKKAERIEVIDLGERVDYADFVVLMTGRSDRQVASIAQGVEDQVKLTGGHPRNDGRRGASWICLDCGDVWVHVFLDEARKHYDIEGLWMDAPRVSLPPELRAPKTNSVMDGSDEADGE
jgi:ribosome-associated protein